MIDELGITVDENAVTRMLQHESLLQAWNPRINLTRITEPTEIARRHFGEALFLAREAGFANGTVADLGAGAGFPGLPIAAWQPEVQVSEVESIAKKATFLREVSRDWSNVKVIDSRIEAVEHTFDWVIMRAVAIEPLVERLAQLAPRVALLAGSRTAEVLQQGGFWTVKVHTKLPWEGSGELLIAERV